MEIDPLKIPAFMRRHRAIAKKSGALLIREVKAKPAAKPAIKIEIPRPSYRQPAVIAFADPLFDAPIKPARIKPQKILMPIGTVTHYFDKIKVAVLQLQADIEMGCSLQLVSEKGPFKQKLNSMQINRQDVQSAKRGDAIGIKVKKPVVIGETAYSIQ